MAKNEERKTAGPEVCLLIKSLSGGGTEKVCAALALALSELGWAVTVAVFERCHTHLEQEVAERTTLVDFGAARVSRGLMPIIKFLKERRGVLLFAFNYEICALILLSRLFMGSCAPVLLRSNNTLSHTLSSKGRLYRMMRRTLIKLVMLGTDGVISQSRGMTDDLVRSFSVPRNKIHEIGNPLSWRFETLESGEAVLKYAYIVLVCRLLPQKDVNLAVSAFKCAFEDGLDGVKLVIVGDGPQRSELVEYVKQQGIERNVEFLGYRADVRNLLRFAVLTILTSRFEGFPNVIIESISQGTPVVSVDCPSGPREIIKSGVNGLLVSSRNPRDIGTAITEALTMQWNREVIVETSMHFRTNTIVSQYAEVLKGLNLSERSII